jgi:protein-disulfide isomerase
MTKRAALGAVVATAALALLDGCGGMQRLPGEHALAGPGVRDDAIDIDSFATRIDPKKVPLATTDNPSRGPAAAPVTIHLFSDFECPYCRGVGPVLREIEAEFGGSVRTVWHNFPLPGHPHAELAAVAGVLVYRRRGGAAFWRFHDATFDAAAGGLDPAVIQALARREGVDPATLRAALATGADGRIALDIATGDAAGIEGTPAFFVNDRMVTGVLPYPEFRALVLRALAEARQK